MTGGGAAAFSYAAASASRPTSVEIGPLARADVAPPDGAAVVFAAAALLAPSSPSRAAVFAFAARLGAGAPVAVGEASPGPGGDEACKELSAVARFYDALAAADVDRRGLVVAVGGGALLDAAGFAAATWHRGTPFWSVPTTLVAQVDAALGGKTALDFRGAKNQLGVVRQPTRILVDPDFLATLSETQYRSGLGEVAKTALLAGGATYDGILRDARLLRARDRDALARTADSCLRYKASVVASDPDETTGARFLLNAGHTLGHVYEAAAAERGAPVPHGLCVAAGLVAEAAAVLGPAGAAVARAPLAALGVDEAPPRIDAATALRLLRADKKRGAGGAVRVAVVSAPGRAELRLVPLEDLVAAAVAGG